MMMPSVQNHTGAEPNSDAQNFEQFVYLLSHDIRNSVRALNEVPLWIKEDLEADNYQCSQSLIENFALIDTHTRRLDQMLADLLIYSRVGRGQPVCALNLTETIETALRSISVPPGFRIDLDLWQETLIGGKDDLVVMFTALLSNAIKHHDKQTGIVSISSRLHEGHCVIRFTDDGPGIPESHRERALEPMTTLKSRDEVEGSGMGLAITRKITEKYGGRLEWMTLDSPTGTGLELTFPA